MRHASAKKLRGRVIGILGRTPTAPQWRESKRLYKTGLLRGALSPEKREEIRQMLMASFNRRPEPKPQSYTFAEQSYTPAPAKPTRWMRFVAWLRRTTKT